MSKGEIYHEEYRQTRVEGEIPHNMRRQCHEEKCVIRPEMRMSRLQSEITTLRIC